MERWPNVFLVGAPKAGTTSIYAYLDDMPGIYMSPIKEPNYFSRAIVPAGGRNAPIRDKAAYLKLFGGAAPGELLGEASPTYLHDPDASTPIREVSPDARIIVTLRDPVDLVFSLYRLLLGRDFVGGSFAAAVTHRLSRKSADWSRPQLRIEYGFYYEALKRYLDVFGTEQVQVLLFEDLARDPAGIMRTVAQFLRLPEPQFSDRLQTYNASAVPRNRLTRALLANRRITHAAERLLSPRVRRSLRERLLVRPAAAPAMEDAARDALVALYAEDVGKTSSLLGRSLPWRHFAATA